MLKSLLLKKVLPIVGAVVPVYLTVELIGGKNAAEPMVSPLLLNDVPEVTIEPIHLPASGTEGDSSITVPKIQLLIENKTPEAKESKKEKIEKNKKDTKSKETPPPPPPSKPSTGEGTRKRTRSGNLNKTPEEEIVDVIKSMIGEENSNRLMNNAENLSGKFELISKVRLILDLINESKKEKESNE